MKKKKWRLPEIEKRKIKLAKNDHSTFFVKKLWKRTKIVLTPFEFAMDTSSVRRDEGTYVNVQSH